MPLVLPDDSLVPIIDLCVDVFVGAGGFAGKGAKSASEGSFVFAASSDRPCEALFLIAALFRALDRIDASDSFDLLAESADTGVEAGSASSVFAAVFFFFREACDVPARLCLGAGMASSSLLSADDLAPVLFDCAPICTADRAMTHAVKEQRNLFNAAVSLLLDLLVALKCAGLRAEPKRFNQFCPALTA
jgi:hypothetical protein